MTFEKVLNDMLTGKMKPADARAEVITPAMMKRINYYLHYNDISTEELSESQLIELQTIVSVLQALYDSEVDSPIDNSKYDILQEMLVNLGIPRNTSSIEINDETKVAHKYTTLRGTLDKVYYLFPDDKRINKSRKTMDEWIETTQQLYFRKTGKTIDLNKVTVTLQPKMDGCSSIVEIDKKFRWITRGDTLNNLASDVSHIMNVFNKRFENEPIGTGIKFEVMISEEDKDEINSLMRNKNYHNSRQIVTATLNSLNPDFKVDYLTPIPLRIIHDTEDVESLHPTLLSEFPTEVCTLGDRDRIKKFADSHRYVLYKGKHFRTDGVVLTINDKEIQRVLGRENNINNFEVAYKFTEESAISKVKDVEFKPSDFGYICPVLIVNDVILKGNTVSRITLSNKERFDELNLSYGDEVKVLYDIIPYAIIDDTCKRVPNGRKIEFIDRCPRCGEPLDLNVTQVRCQNKNCPSRIIGRIQNYCTNVRIQNIGYSTLDLFYTIGLLDNGIPDLYRLKKHIHEIEGLEGFGTLKAKKIIAEVEAKRKLNDYEFFGSIGVDGLSIKTFQLIFSKIKLSEFMNLLKVKNFNLLGAKLLTIPGIGPAKVGTLIQFFQDKKMLAEVEKLVGKELTLTETFGASFSNGRVTFTGCRPTPETVEFLSSNGYEAADGWSNSATKYLVIPNTGFTSSKVDSANDRNIPIIALDGQDQISTIRKVLGI